MPGINYRALQGSSDSDADSDNPDEDDDTGSEDAASDDEIKAAAHENKVILGKPSSPRAKKALHA